MGIETVFRAVGVLAAAFTQQCMALMDAKAMLLIDDDEPEASEPDRVLKQRMRADRNLGLAACE